MLFVFWNYSREMIPNLSKGFSPVWLARALCKFTERQHRSCWPDQTSGLTRCTIQTLNEQDLWRGRKRPHLCRTFGKRVGRKSVFFFLKRETDSALPVKKTHENSLGSHWLFISRSRESNSSPPNRSETRLDRLGKVISWHLLTLYNCQACFMNKLPFITRLF